MNCQHLHHRWFAFVALGSFFLHFKATKVVVEAFVDCPEWHVRVKAGYLDVSGPIDPVICLAAVYEDVVRQRSNYARRDDLRCSFDMLQSGIMM
jgi:hypothetical protein